MSEGTMTLSTYFKVQSTLDELEVHRTPLLVINVKYMLINEKETRYNYSWSSMSLIKL